VALGKIDKAEQERGVTVDPPRKITLVESCIVCVYK